MPHFNDEMIKVLENCHEVLIKGGKFIIVNSCNPEAGDIDHNVTSSGLHPGFRGIHIMTLCKQEDLEPRMSGYSCLTDCVLKWLL